MDVSFQKSIAAKILKCGKSRVYIDPKALDDVSEAITREDIRMLIKKGLIKKMPKKGNSRSRIRKNMKQKQKGLRNGQRFKERYKICKVSEQEEMGKGNKIHKKRIKESEKDENR
jgi:Ribosomal protein L19E